MAVQVEAVAADGERVSFPPGAKRVSVEGSRFGPRVFWAVGDVANGVHVCEGVTDALALFHLQCLGAGFRAAAALGVGPTAGICGVHSASGFRLEAIPGSAPVIVWPDGDPAGNSAAGRLAAALARARRRVRVEWRPYGGDLAEWAAVESFERRCLRDEGSAE